MPPVDNSIGSLRQKAEAGDAKSQSDLGIIYMAGKKVSKNPAEGIKWLRKAASQGDVGAQYLLWAYYDKGEGVQKDPVEAARWLRKAAEQGIDIAQVNLGLCYDQGIGVEKDADEAAKWYRKAAEQGLAVAQFDLGNCYVNGNGVKKDLIEAANWYRKSADQGYVTAECAIGWCYYNGSGVQKDPVESEAWLLKAADQGNNNAQGAVGVDYIQGFGVIKNEVEGMAWLYVSSANGNATAANEIASNEKIYNGEIIEQARHRAIELQTQVASRTTKANDVSAFPQKPAETPKASGSGAFISADGLVLTAAHVVQGASRIEVVTAAGKLAASVVKIDATNDVALLKCTGSNFTPIPIAPSKSARAGTTVFTIGFPNIQIQGFDPKLTKGEISSQTGFQDDPRSWQISVPIQPGNSGGPLCDENGNLIGIVEATLDPLAMAKIAREIPQNVNYAVKSSYILPLLDDVQNLPQPRVATSSEKFEDVVDSVRPSTVLILVY